MYMHTHIHLQILSSDLAKKSVINRKRTYNVNSSCWENVIAGLTYKV